MIHMTGRIHSENRLPLTPCSHRYDGTNDTAPFLSSLGSLSCFWLHSISLSECPHLKSFHMVSNDYDTSHLPLANLLVVSYTTFPPIGFLLKRLLFFCLNEMMSLFRPSTHLSPKKCHAAGWLLGSTPLVWGCCLSDGAGKAWLTSGSSKQVVICGRNATQWHTCRSAPELCMVCGGE